MYDTCTCFHTHPGIQTYSLIASHPSDQGLHSPTRMCKPHTHTLQPAHSRAMAPHTCGAAPHTSTTASHACPVWKDAPREPTPAVMAAAAAAAALSLGAGEGEGPGALCSSALFFWDSTCESPTRMTARDMSALLSWGSCWNLPARVPPRVACYSKVLKVTLKKHQSVSQAVRTACAAAPGVRSKYGQQQAGRLHTRPG